MFAFQDTAGTVEIAFTDRHAHPGGGPSASGGSPEPSGPLDLSAIPRDEAHAAPVRRSLALLGAALGAPAPRFALMRQVHGADVAVVDAATLDRDEVPVADALVTDLAGVALVARVADCVPVLLADPAAGVDAAVHAGRAGLVAGVVPAALDAMGRLGATDVRGWVGPHVCGGCYEVPERLRAEVGAVAPRAWAETTWGTPSLDIGAGVLAQLADGGVDVVDASRCTVEDQDLYSYRRQGAVSGRLGGLVWRRP